MHGLHERAIKLAENFERKWVTKIGNFRIAYAKLCSPCGRPLFLPLDGAPQELAYDACAVATNGNARLTKSIQIIPHYEK